MLYQLERNLHILHDLRRNVGLSETWDLKITNRYQYAGATEVMDMLLGIRYLLCRNTRTLHTAYEKIGESASFDLYENPRALKGAYMINNSVADYAMEGTDPLEVQNRLLSGIVGKRLYKMQTINSDSLLAGRAVFTVRLKKGEHGYLYIPGTEPENVTINGQSQTSDYWNNNFLDLGTCQSDTTVRVTADCGMEEAVLGTYQESDLDEIYRTRLSSQQTDLSDGEG